MKTIAFTPGQYQLAKEYISWNFEDANVVYKSSKLIIIEENESAAKALLEAAEDALADYGMEFAKTDIRTIIKAQVA